MLLNVKRMNLVDWFSLNFTNSNMTEQAGIDPPEVPRTMDDTLIESLRRDRPDVARIIVELNNTVGHAGPGAVFNEELRDPEGTRLESLLTSFYVVDK